MPDLKMEYAVAVGDGAFPFYMLWHDQCFPSCEHCSWSLEGDENEGERIIILAKHKQEPSGWTPKLWDHFGWSLIVYNGRGFDNLEDAKYAVEMLKKTADLAKETK